MPARDWLSAYPCRHMNPLLVRASAARSMLTRASAVTGGAVTGGTVTGGAEAGRPAAGGKRLAWLDAMRGFAALCVVFDHSSYRVLLPARNFLYHWLDFGQY